MLDEVAVANDVENDVGSVRDEVVLGNVVDVVSWVVVGVEIGITVGVEIVEMSTVSVSIIVVSSVVAAVVVVLMVLIIIYQSKLEL